MHRVIFFIVLFVFMAIFPMMASASYLPTNNSNVGIGTFSANARLIVTGGNVGIGSLSPGQVLDVTGTVRATSFIGDGSGLTGLSAAGWSQSGSSITQTGNNVGLGTTTPQAAFVVTNGNVGIGTWTASAMQHIVQTGAVDGFRVDDAAQDTTPFIITSDGNVGIGSAAPQTALAVASLADFRSNVFITGATNNRGLFFDNPGSFNYGMFRDDAGNLAFRSNGVGSSQFNIQATTGNVGIGTTNGNALMDISSTAAQNLFRVNDNGTGDTTPFVIDSTGNVGIGSVNAQKLLVIRGADATNVTPGTSNVALRLLNTDISATGKTSEIQFASDNSGQSSDNQVFAAISGIVTTAGAGTFSSGQLALTTRNNSGSIIERMRIDYAGNIGIATLEPNALLDISSTAAQNLFRVNDSGTGDISPFIIDSVGNVGIGTLTSPWSKLVVLGTAPSDASLTRGTPAAVSFGVNAGYELSMNQWTASPWTWWMQVRHTEANVSGPMALNPLGGNVGISTFVPNALLDISSTAAQNLFRVNDNGTADPTPFIIDSVGNVGIGSLTPGTALDVTGTVRATSFIGDGSGLTGLSGTGWTVSGSDVYKSSGNVGIGSATPLALIEVRGASSAGTIPQAAFTGGAASNGTSDLYIVDSLNLSSGIGFGAKAIGVNIKGQVNSANQVVQKSTWSGVTGSAAIYLGSDDNNQGGFGVLTAPQGSAADTPLIERFTVRGGGNVGIGTFNPFGGQLIIPTTNGNVGIGSLAPGTPLDVTGTVRATSFIGDGSGLTNVTASSGWRLGASNVGISTTNNVGIGTSLTTTSALTVMNGNVGIGTWVPASLFEIVSPVTGTILRLKNNTLSGSADLDFTVSTSNLAMGKISAIRTAGLDTSLAFSTYQNATGTLTEKMRLTEIGNLGIGTTTPQGAFVVTNGNVGIGTWAPIYPLDIVSSGGEVRILSTVNSRFLTVNTSAGTLDMYNAGLNLNRLSTTDVTLATGGGNVGVGTNMVGNAGKFIVIGGNVGIGTITPQAVLDIVSTNGDVRIVSTLNSRYFTANASTGSIDFYNATFNINRYATTDVSLVNGGGNVGVGTGMTGHAGKFVVIGGNVGIGTVTPQGGFVVTNGNVGIGTWTAAQALDVRGTVRATSFIGDGSGLTGIAGTGWTVSGNDAYKTIGNVGIGTTLTTTSALTVMSGNVGIGTWVPAVRLQINTPVGGAAFRHVDPTSGISFAVGAYGVTAIRVGTDGINNQSLTVGTGGDVGHALILKGFSATQSANLMEWRRSSDADLGAINAIGNMGIGTSDPQAALVVTNGNVGIGTWTASSALVVRGDIAVPGYSTNNFIGLSSFSGLNPGDNAGRVGLTGASSIYMMLDSNNDQTNTVFAVNNNSNSLSSGSTLFQVEESGNVGIGTTIISAKLVVTQTATADAFLVEDQANDTTPFVINSAGNLGIGTTTPTAYLDIATSGDVDFLKIRGANDFPTLSITNAQSKTLTIGYINTNFGSNQIPTIANYGASGSISMAAASNLMFIAGGRINFYNSSNHLNPQSVLDPISGRVGFGTYNPGSALSINGGVGIGTTGGSTPNAYVSLAAPSGGLIVENNVGIGTFNPFGGRLIVSGGNVGIGSLTPGQVMDVTGTVRATRFIGDGSGLSNVSASSGWALGASNVGISTTNNVGIGSLNPNAKLSIDGDVFIKETAQGGYNPSSSMTFRAWQNTAKLDYTILQRAPTVGEQYLDIKDYTGAVVVTIPSGGSLYAASRLGVGLSSGLAAAGAMELGYTASKLTIYSNSHSLPIEVGNLAGWFAADGNVGINTFSPQASLDVSSTEAQNLFRVNDNGAADGSPFLIDQGGNVGIGTTAAITSTGLYIHTTLSTPGFEMVKAAGNPTDQIMAIWGDSIAGQPRVSNRFTITRNGNTGIGTFAPNALLDISSTAAQDLFEVNDNGTGDTTPFIIDSVGNVGIGTAQANFALDVNASTSAILRFASSDATYGPIVDLRSVSNKDATIRYYKNDATTGWTTGLNGVTNNFVFAYGVYAPSLQPPQLVIQSNGNVGIGTIAATAFLDISTTSAVDLLRVNDNGTGDVTPAIFVDSAGNVGIGTLQTNGYQLSIPNAVVSGTQSSTFNQIYFANSGVDAMLYLANNVFWISHPSNGVNSLTFDMNTGNMGVGTFTANAILDVSSTAAYDLFRVNDNALGDTTPFIVNSVGNVGISTIRPGKMLEVVGNVGIGTTGDRYTLSVNNSIVYNSLYDNGNSSTSLTINWNNGSNQKVTLTGNCTFTFTAPTVGVARLLLEMVQDGVGSKTVTWPAAVKWPGGAAPTLTTTASAVDYVSCFYNGTNYNCTDSLDFR